MIQVFTLHTYITPMPHAYLRKIIDMAMKYMQVYAPCIGFVHTQEVGHIQGAKQSQD
jgi:hypothetical protein